MNFYSSAFKTSPEFQNIVSFTRRIIDAISKETPICDIKNENGSLALKMNYLFDKFSGKYVAVNHKVLIRRKINISTGNSLCEEYLLMHSDTEF